MTGTPAADEPTPGLLSQVGKTRDALVALLKAHLALLRTELTDILGQVKVLAAIGGIVLVLALLMTQLLFVGGLLFLGEWLFGSIGWGLAHGVLLAVALMVVLSLLALGAKGRRIGLGLLISLLVIVAIALATGTNAAPNAARTVAASLPAPINSPGVAALLVGAIVGALVLLIVGWRVGGRSGGLAGLIAGVFIGAIVGWLVGGAPWTWPPALGFAISIGLLTWPIVQLALSLPGLEVGERFKRLSPKQSIAAATETREWLEEQWRTKKPKSATK